MYLLTESLARVAGNVMTRCVQSGWAAGRDRNPRKTPIFQTPHWGLPTAREQHRPCRSLGTDLIRGVWGEGVGPCSPVKCLGCGEEGRDFFFSLSLLFVSFCYPFESRDCLWRTNILAPPKKKQRFPMPTQTQSQTRGGSPALKRT